MRKSIFSVGFFVSMALIPVMHGGCGGTSTGNPRVDLQFGTYSAQNSFRLLDFFIPSAYAALSGAKLCIRRLRFKPDGSSPASGGDIDFQPGEITLNTSGGTDLGVISIPPGTYKRVEFDLTTDGAGCTSGHSVTFTNANSPGGLPYYSTDGTTIKFEGVFTASQGVQILSLGLQGIVNALNTISGPAGYNSSIAGTLQNASVKGSF